MAPRGCTQVKIKVNVNGNKLWAKNSPEENFFRAFTHLEQYLVMPSHSFKVILADSCCLIKQSVLDLLQSSELYIKFITEQLKLLKTWI